MASNGSKTVTFQKLIDVGILEIGDGYRAKNSELGGIGPIFLRAGHVTDTHIDFEGVEQFHAELADKVRPKMAHPGDTIVTTKGNSTGRTSFVTQRMPPFVYSPHLSYWRSLDSQKLKSGFLRYWSRGREFRNQLTGMKASTDMAPYLSLTDQRRLNITLPPLPIQKAIAHILGTLDDKIELNRRMNETLEGMARAIFKSWFVDFDPVRAKMDGRQPPGMDADTAALFPDRFQESKLGPIPKNWEVRSVRDVTDALFDGPHATPPKSDEGAVFLGIKNLTGTQIDLSEIRHISEKNWSKWTRRVTPQAGDIVFSYEATLGFFALIPPGLRCCLGRRLALVRPKKKASFEHFLFHTFTSAPFQQLLVERSVHGSTVDRIPLLQFPDFQILFPPEALRKRFEAFAASVWQRIHVNQEEIRSLAATRDALLPRLLSGNIDISECGESNAGSRTTVGGTRKR